MSLCTSEEKRFSILNIVDTTTKYEERYSTGEKRRENDANDLINAAP